MIKYVNNSINASQSIIMSESESETSGYESNASNSSNVRLKNKIRGINWNGSDNEQSGKSNK